MMNIMGDLNINVWLEEFRKKLVELFGGRLRFFGIQGSYGRGESSADSDIDVVVIVDDMTHYDLLAYRNMIDAMKFSSKICGFVSGTAELLAWEKPDLLQLVLDTQPIIGSLDSFGISFTKEDVRSAVRAGACNLYHACSHNLLHARSMEALAGLFKAARFTVRMKHYYITGNYVAMFSKLADVVSVEDRQILTLAKSITDGCGCDVFDGYSMILLDWASDIIKFLR